MVGGHHVARHFFESGQLRGIESIQILGKPLYEVIESDHELVGRKTLFDHPPVGLIGLRNICADRRFNKNTGRVEFDESESVLICSSR